jgi:ankyrin repeat protein
MIRRHLPLALLLTTTTTAVAQAALSPGVPAEVAKPIALLQRTGTAWFDKQTCRSCHQQDLPMMTFRLARERGVAIDRTLMRQEISRAYGFLSSLDRAVQHTHLIDPAMDYGMSLVAAHDAGVPASLSTAIYANLIASRQRPDGRWITVDLRPPQAHSEFTATAVAMRAVQLYMPARRAGEVRDRVSRASAWLTAAQPRTTEDSVFQLRGLAWAGVDAAHLKPLADRLLAQQHADGGWSQLSRLDSDAYATGEVLVALREAHMPAADPAWQRGLSYLKRTQKPDGSWLVRSRLHEQRLVSPPYFESGFPYGASQMVSCMATSWATSALLLATDAAGMPGGQEPIDIATVTASGVPWMEAALFGTDGELKALLDRGLDPNSSTDGGTSLLMMAAGDLAKVRVLLERGAHVNARAATGFTALMVAANAGATRSVQALLDRGAAVRVSEPAALFNASAAFFGVFSGETETLDLLADRGADIMQKMSVLGQSPVRPLDLAVVQRDVPMMRDLVRRGVNLNADDPDAPVSALSLAVFANDVPMAKALIELGADVNKVDSVGLTALLHAVSVDFGDVEMVRALLAAGANPAIRSQGNASAEELAERYGHRDFLPLLRRQ